MVTLNVEFQEKYKRLDALCKDMFNGNEGVSAYIRKMESTSLCYRSFDWDSTYKQLKHLRWVRNQLAHEVGAFNSDICTQEDLNWLTGFHNAILRGTDPLAYAGQAQRAREQRITTKKTTPEEKPQPLAVKEEPSSPKVQKVSLWSKIKSAIKSWFS